MELRLLRGISKKRQRGGDVVSSVLSKIDANTTAAIRRSVREADAIHKDHHGPASTSVDMKKGVVGRMARHG